MALTSTLTSIRLLPAALALGAGLLCSQTAANADQAASHADHAGAAAQAATELSEGEIRKIDKEAGKLTIRHGELKNLAMPPMTMVFRAQEPAMLDAVQVGDKVQFVADRIGGQFTVTRIEVNK